MRAGKIVTGDQLREALRALSITDMFRIEDIRQVTITPGHVEVDVMAREVLGGNAIVVADDIVHFQVRFPIRWFPDDDEGPEIAGSDMPARGAGISNVWPA